MLPVDNSLSSVGPTRDELVPSRYALRSGEIDARGIRGDVLPVTAHTLATNATPSDLASWLNQNMPFPSVGHVVVDGDIFRWVPVDWDY